MPLSARHDYIQRVLALYRCTPGASGFARRADRHFAAALFDRRVPLRIVHAAFLLAVARRASRPQHAEPLPKIATLHYFLPIIEELLATPPDPGYLLYLRYSLASIVPALLMQGDEQAVDHRFP